jgi:hypothetical protein
MCANLEHGSYFEIFIKSPLYFLSRSKKFNAQENFLIDFHSWHVYKNAYFEKEANYSQKSMTNGVNNVKYWIA